MPYPQKAIILLSRGGYSQAPSRQLRTLTATVQLAYPDRLVIGAMVDKGSPSLPQALQQCAEAGATKILIQPIFMPGDDNLERWLGKVVMRWHSQWSGEAVELCLAESLGDQAAFQDGVVEAIRAVQPEIQNVLATPPKNWQTDPAGWSKIPNYAYHVLLCQGPRCTALGAGRLPRCLSEQLKQNKLTAPNRVLVVQTGCLYPCNLGPMMVVYPDGVWYGHLTPHAIDQIVTTHFAKGDPVAEYVCYTGR